MQDLRTYRIKAGFSRSSQKKGERNNFSYAAQAFSTSFYEPSTARLKQTKQNKKADGKKMPSLKLANSSPAPGLEKRSRSEPRALGTHQQFSATTKGRRARRADLGLHFHQGFSRSQWKPCYQNKRWLDLIRWLCNEEQVRALLAEGQRLGGSQ